MLLNQRTLAGIESGTISLAFRRWRRPTVKSGGTLLTAIGQLAVESVDRVELDAISPREAAAAGFSDVVSLRSALQKRKEGEVYRIRLCLEGPDPRIALREAIPEGPDMELLVQRVRRLDARSASGPWTHGVMELISRQPATRAGDLADEVGMERADFKVRVRKLKALGLTQSLKVGYKLSPRGEAVLKELSASG